MKKKANVCAGGVSHPSRKGMKCWGNHDLIDKGHWAYITDKGELRMITWRV